MPIRFHDVSLGLRTAASSPSATRGDYPNRAARPDRDCTTDSVPVRTSKATPGMRKEYVAGEHTRPACPFRRLAEKLFRTIVP